MNPTETNAQTKTDFSIDKIVSAADSLMRTQSIMSWENRIKGTLVDFESTYRGYEWLFTPESIAFVDEQMKMKGLSKSEHLALSFLKDYLVEQYVDREVVSYDDRLTNTESDSKVFVSWLNKNVPYREIPILIAKEDAANKRKELELLSSQVQREKLNPIVVERDAKIHKLIEGLGYKSYLDYSLESRHVKDFRKMIEDANIFIKNTDELYKKLLTQFAKENLGMEVKDIRRSDLQKIMRFDSYVPYFPAEAMIPFLKHFLSNIGLDLKTVDGSEILLDDEARPKKNPRAACYSITVPSDIRMTIAPHGGLDDFDTLFHETGHAIHYANTTVPSWSFKYLGDYSATESYAGLFASQFGSPDFLKFYRDFIVEWNKNHEPVPVLTDSDIEKLVRFSVFNELYFMRRYAGAKLIFESIYHSNQPKWWKGIYDGQTTDKREAYRVLFEKAYGFTMDDIDAERYLTDIDDFLYAADYVRSFVLSSQINQKLSEKFSTNWFENKNVGEFLKNTLFAPGNEFSADDVAIRLGYRSVDFNAYEKEIRSKL